MNSNYYCFKIKLSFINIVKLLTVKSNLFTAKISELKKKIYTKINYPEIIFIENFEILQIKNIWKTF